MWINLTLHDVRNAEIAILISVSALRCNADFTVIADATVCDISNFVSSTRNTHDKTGRSSRSVTFRNITKQLI